MLVYQNDMSLLTTGEEGPTLKRQSPTCPNRPGPNPPFPMTSLRSLLLVAAIAAVPCQRRVFGWREPQEERTTPQD